MNTGAKETIKVPYCHRHLTLAYRQRTRSEQLTRLSRRILIFYIAPTVSNRYSMQCVWCVRHKKIICTLLNWTKTIYIYLLKIVITWLNGLITRNFRTNRRDNNLPYSPHPFHGLGCDTTSTFYQKCLFNPTWQSEHVIRTGKYKSYLKCLPAQGPQALAQFADRIQIVYVMFVN